jgi:hypothetical protein
MKKKLKLSKKTIKNLKLKLKKVSDRKAAPLLYVDPIFSDDGEPNPTNGSSC